MTAKNTKKNVVLPHDREAFKLMLHAWQERLGMIDWRITVSDKPARRAVMAEVVKFDYESRQLTIRLGEHFGAAPVNADNMESLVVHELLHGLLHELLVLTADPKTPEDVKVSAEHRVIHVLEKLLVPGAHQ